MANDFFFRKLEHARSHTNFKRLSINKFILWILNFIQNMTILKICPAIFVNVFRVFPQSVYDHVGTVAGNMARPFLHQYFTVHCTRVSPY